MSSHEGLKANVLSASSGLCIQEQGFKGSIQALYRFLQSLRQHVSSLLAPGVADRIPVKTALWLIARPYENLKVEERADLEELCQSSQELAALHRLAQSFGKLVRQREGDRLDEWMKQVGSLTYRDIKRFGASLQRDKEEVLAGLSLIHSNGMTEGGCRTSSS